MKKIKAHEPRPIRTAIGLYDHYIKDPYNFELRACTNSAIENYDEMVDARISFAKCMQILRDTDDESGNNIECIRRLREIRQGRDVIVQKGLMDKEYSDDMEENWLNADYMMKKWKRYKQVYHFSDPLMRAMANTDKQGFVADVLQYLPFSSFYIDLTNYDDTIVMEGYGRNFTGCFISISLADKAEDREPEWVIRLLFCTEYGDFFFGHSTFPRGIKTTIQEGIPEGSDEESEQSQKDISFLVVNLIAYIASSNADIEKSPTPSTPSWRRTGGKAQKGAPVTDWNVGYRIGPAIEKAFSKTYTDSSSAGGSHASPRPHIRAAHWHHYWTGPKEERQLSLRWVSQAFVNCTDAENLPVVERRDKNRPE